MLTKYAIENGFRNIEVFVDDGYSGVFFDRPAFQKILNLIEENKVDTLITKDLSRLGRNYISVGNYIEMEFPHRDVRYIAVNDNYDSNDMNSSSNELAPFKNLFNEWFARDTSKKIRAVIKSKAERGERIGSHLKLDKRFTSYGDKAQEIATNGVVGKIDNTEVVVAPSDYFPEGVNYIIVYKTALISPLKLSEYLQHDLPIPKPV